MSCWSDLVLSQRLHLVPMVGGAVSVVVAGWPVVVVGCPSLLDVDCIRPGRILERTPT